MFVLSNCAVLILYSVLRTVKVRRVFRVNIIIITIIIVIIIKN